MRTVEDESGRRYLLEKESRESSRVRDPETGEERYVANDRLSAVDRSPLETSAESVPAPVRRLLAAVPDDRALGLLLEIDARGPVSVRALLGYDLCESDLHGLLAEFVAAGLIEEAAVDGERGYETTDAAARALAGLQSAGADA